MNCQINPYCIHVRTLHIQRCSRYLSGRVYDMIESGGGRGSKPIRGWLVTSCRYTMSANRNVAVIREVSAIQGLTVQSEFGSIRWWEYWKRSRKAIYLWFIEICGGICNVVRWQKTTLLNSKNAHGLYVLLVYISHERQTWNGLFDFWQKNMTVDVPRCTLIPLLPPGTQ